MIFGQDIDEVLYRACIKLKHARETSPRGFKTKELIQETLVIENPKKCVITNPARKFSLKYLEEELKWYMSGDKSIKNIGEHASLWKKIADKDGNVNSNYGEIIFKQELDGYNGSQWDWVIESLTNDKDSRQALININQPKHKYPGVKDFPCTLSIQYLIRDDSLVSITNMRSNDLVYGFGYDFPFFSFLQQKLHKELKKTYPFLQLGVNVHTAGSLHTYEKHYEMMDNIIKEYTEHSFKSDELKIDI